MALPKKCCCCSLKGGAIAVGVTMLVLNLIGCIAASGQMAVGSALDKVGTGVKNDDLSDFGKTQTLLGTISLVLCIVAVITNILLLVSTCMKQGKAAGRLVLPYVAWQSVHLLSCLIFALMYLIKIGTAAMFYVGYALVFVGMGLYCVIMMVSYYQWHNEEPTAAPAEGAEMKVVYAQG